MKRTDAYQRFKDGLLNKKMAAGQFMTQRDLSEMMKISLGPLRDALARLEAEGLVRVHPQRGVEIAPYDPHLARQLFDVRVIIERSAAPAFLRSVTDRRLDALAASCRQMIEKVEALGDDPVPIPLRRQAMKVDYELHTEIVRAPGNSVLEEIYVNVRDRLTIMRQQTYHNEGRIPGAMRDHLAIIEAARARNEEGFFNALDAHLNISVRQTFGIY